MWLVYAQTSTLPTTDPLLTLVNYGILGVFVIGLIMGWVWVKPAVEQAFAQYKQTIERQEAQIERLILERNELRNAIQAQLSNIQSQVERVREEQAETSHAIESITVRPPPRRST